MEQLISYLAGVLTPITLFVIYAILLVGKDDRDD